MRPEGRKNMKEVIYFKIINSDLIAFIFNLFLINLFYIPKGICKPFARRAIPIKNV